MNQMTMRIPSLKFFHASKDASKGSAVFFELHPAHGATDGALYVRMAKQMPMSEKAQFPQFDFENSIVFKLDFTDVSKMLQVLRGECESIGQYEGLMHMSTKHTTHISFEHHIEPTSRYILNVCRVLRSAEATQERCSFAFTTAEATGLCEALAGSMWMLAFGTGFEATSIAIARDEAKLQAEQTAHETTAETAK